MNGPSDAELMTRTRAGDQTAFSEIVERYKNTVVNYLTRLTGSRDRAEDAAQETFLKLYQSVPKYREEGHLAALIYRIATNHVRSEDRRQNRWRIFRARMPSDGNGNGRLPTPQEQLLKDEAARVLTDALHKLPLKFRVPVVLREIENLPYEDIADVTGLQLGTVKSRISRGRLQLREQLEPYWRGGMG